jgi:serine/threonine-protein kinase HipA
LGYQQMRVGALGHEASLTNALSQARAFGLTDVQAQQTVAEIARQVAHWKAVFKGLNVRDQDIDLLAQYLDGAHLREQRRLAL